MSAPRRAFTLIEILLVVAVVAILGMVSIGGLAGTLRALAVDRASNLIAEAARTARSFALRADQPRDETRRYGVVLVDAAGGMPAWVGITWGPTATADDLLRDAQGRPVFQRVLASRAAFFVASDEQDAPNRLNGEAGWMFQYDTGSTTLRPDRHLRPTFVGVQVATINASGIEWATCERHLAHLALGDDDGNLRLRLACTASGILASTPWR